MERGEATVPEDQSIARIPSIAARREVGAILAVVALVAIGTLIRGDVFWSSQNLLGIIRNTATVSIIGYGMTLLIVSGEFDLSVGSWMGVAMALTAILFLQGWPLLLVVGLVLLLSAIYGLFQGLLVTKLGLPSLIVTIGTLTLLRGVLLVITDGVTISISELGAMFYLGGLLDLSGIAGVQFSSFPIQIIWMFVILGLAYYVLNQTAFGLRSQFTGGDVDSARRTGVKTDHVKIMNFMLVASLAAFAGMTQLAFSRAVSPLSGQGIELTVIAAVVIGGTNLFGGEGSMPGTFLGALVFAITQNVLVIAGLGTQLFQIFSGVFIILAVLVEVLSKEARPKIVVTEYVEPLTELLASPSDFFEYVKTDIQGIDKPLGFLSMSTLLLTLLTIGFLFLSGAFLPWEFSFLFLSAGVSAFGTVPIITFGSVTAMGLITAGVVQATVKVFGSDRDIDTTLQAVMYSLAPSVLLFLPILLAGWGFLGSVVFGSVALIAIPVVYFLYCSTMVLHSLGSRQAIATTGSAIVSWVLIGVIVVSSIPSL